MVSYVPPERQDGHPALLCSVAEDQDRTGRCQGRCSPAAPPPHLHLAVHSLLRPPLRIDCPPHYYRTSPSPARGSPLSGRVVTSRRPRSFIPTKSRSTHAPAPSPRHTSTPATAPPRTCFMNPISAKPNIFPGIKPGIFRYLEKRYGQNYGRAT